MSQPLLIHLQEHLKESLSLCFVQEVILPPDVLQFCKAITLDEVRSAQSLNRKGKGN